MTTPRYDADTNNKMNKTTPMIGSNNANAAIPARGSSSIMTCSGPYAGEEIASGESAPSATGFDNLSDSSCSLVSGLPRTMRFQPSTKVGGMLELRSDVVAKTHHFLISRRTAVLRTRLSGYPQRSAQPELLLPPGLGWPG